MILFKLAKTRSFTCSFKPQLNFWVCQFKRAAAYLQRLASTAPKWLLESGAVVKDVLLQAGLGLSVDQ